MYLHVFLLTCYLINFVWQIKKDYYEERITAGPQSKILEGITWDEAQKAKVVCLVCTDELSMS